MTTYEKKLNSLLDRIFERSTHLSLEEFAKKSGLAISTVWRIDQRYTRFPRLKTIFALARAVGMDLELVEREVKIGRSI